MKKLFPSRHPSIRKSILLIFCLTLTAVVGLGISVSSHSGEPGATESAAQPVQTQRNNLADRFPSIFAPLLPSPTITVKKSDLILNDGADVGKASVGEKIQYTLTIENSGSSDATNVTVQDAVDINTSYNSGSLIAAPIAVNDSYETIGNTLLEVGPVPSPSTAAAKVTVTGNVFTNDLDFLSDTSKAYDSITDPPDHGTLNFNSNGTFSYTPAADYIGTDSFKYRIKDSSNLTDEGTVTITIKPSNSAIAGSTIWYVKNNAGAGGTGTSSSPFNTLLAAQTNAVAGDTIYVYTGSGTTGQNAGITLLSNQRFIGEGVQLDTPNSVNGGASPTVLRAQGTAPSITNAAGNAVTVGSAVANPSVTGVTIRGFNIVSGGVGYTNGIAGTYAFGTGTIIISNNTITGGTGNAIDISTNTTTTGGCTATITSNTISGAGAEGIDINGQGSGGITLDLQSNSVSSTGNGIDINGTGGGVTVISLASNTISGTAGANGIIAQSAKFDATPGGNLDAVSGGTTTIGSPGDGVGGNGLVLINTTGNLSFTDLDVYAAGSFGLQVNGAGQLTSTTGTGISVTSGAGSVTTTNGAAIDIQAATIDLQSFLVTSSGGSDGVSLTNGVFGTFSSTSGSTIANAGSDDFVVGSGTANITWNGALNSSTGHTVNVSGHTGGTVAFTGSITDSGTGILLSSNTGATINFSGGLTLNGTSAVFSATGSGPAATTGGTVNVTGTNTIGGTTPATGPALNVANTTIGASGLTFQKISATGGANGIVLNNTGSTGGLTITGDGGSTNNGSGGTIQNTTGHGIALTNVTGVSLDQMSIPNTGGDGVNGSSVTNFNFTNGTISGAGDGANEFGIFITNLLGTTNTITNSSITNSQTNNLKVSNNSTTLGKLTVSGSTFTTTDATNGGDCVNIETGVGGTLNGNLNVKFTGSNSLNTCQGDGLQAAANDNSTLNISVNGTGSNFNGNLGSAVNIASEGNSQTFALVENLSNVSTGTNGTNGLNVINVQTIESVDSPTMNVTVQNNTVTTQSPSISQNVAGLRLIQEGKGTFNADVKGNTISGRFATNAMVVQSRAGTGKMNLQFGATNTVTTTESTIALDAITMEAGSSAGGDLNTICLNMFNNTASSATAGQAGYRLRKRATPTFQLQGFVGNGTSTADVATWVNTTKSNTGTVDAVIDGGAFTAATCGTTTLPSAMLYLPEQNQQRQYFAQDDSQNSNNSLLAFLNTQKDFSSVSELMPQGATNSGANSSATVKPEIEKSASFELAHADKSRTLGSRLSGLMSSIAATLSPTAHAAPARAMAAPAAPPVGFDINENLGTLPPGEKIVLVFDVNVTSVAAQYSNQATVKYQDGADPTVITKLSDDPDTGAADDSTITTGDVADLQITNSDSPDPVSSGADITYTINFKNNGPADASSVTFSDVLDANTTFVSVNTPSGWTLSNSPAVGSTGTITFTKATVANQETAVFTVVAKVKSDVASAVHILNKASATSAKPDANSANNTDVTADTTTQTRADLEIISNSDAPDPVFAGNNITYTVNFKNNGPSDAQTATVTNPIPANTTLVSADTTTTGWSRSDALSAGASSGNIVFSKGTVPAGETASFTIVLQVDGATANGTDITDTATAASATTDPTPGNNSKAATTTVSRQADLQVSKTASPDPSVFTGANITYTINFKNDGPHDAQTVQLADAVPTNTKFVSAVTPSGWSRTDSVAPNGTGTLTFTKATVANQETAVFTVVVKVDSNAPGGSTITNNAVASSATTDPTPGNSTGTANTSVVACTLSPTVTSGADSGANTLRDAVANVCPGGTITIDASANPIQLSSTIDIDKNMTITGPGANQLTIQGSASGIRALNVKSTATNVNITKVTIGNSASLALGGGLNIESGATVLLSESAVSYNQVAAGGGGGIYNAGTLTIVRSTVSNNLVTAGGGGGILNTGTLNVYNSTISSNTINGGAGGGVLNSGSGVATFVNSTVASNLSDAGGGGIATTSSGATNLGNTIVAYSHSATTPANAVADLSGSPAAFTSQGHNWIQDAGTTGLTSSGDPQIQTTLANNGGATLTQAPLKGSPVVEAGDNALIDPLGETTDQRDTGFARKADSADNDTTQTVDIGAVEAEPTISDIPNKTDGLEDTTITGYSFHVGDATIGIDTITASATTDPSGVIQSVSVNNSSSDTPDLTIVPVPNKFGTATITVTVNKTIGGTPLSQSDTFDVTFGSVNDVPVANNDSTNVDEDATLTVNAAGGVLGNDTDVDSPTLTASLDSPPSHAQSFSLNPDGSYSYRATQDFNGTDSFTYKASDGTAESNAATVTITVNAVNDPVTNTVPASATVNEDSSTSVTGMAIADVDAAIAPSGVYEVKLSSTNGTMTLTTIPAGLGFTFGDGTADASMTFHGTLADINTALGTASYTPNADYSGSAEIKLESSDLYSGSGIVATGTGSATNDTDTIPVTVTSIADAPTATGATTTEDTQTTSGLVITRNANDSTDVAFFKITNIQNGTLYKNNGTTQINNDDIITDVEAGAGLKFTPAANLFSPTTTPFSFDVQGATSNTGNGLGTAATATITVDPVADTPTVTPASTIVNVQTTSGLVISRNAVDSTEVTHFKITNIQNGTLFKNNGTTQINSGDFITFAEGNAGLKFTPALNSTTTGHFDIQGATSNTGNGLSGVVTANINIGCTSSSIVTKTADDGSTGTLRDAIFNACPGDNITFDIPTSDPGYLAGVYTISLTAGELAIDRDVTITGLGANVLTVKRDSSVLSRFRVFTIANNAITVNITGMTISNGKTADGTAGNPGTDGGAILNNASATLNLKNVAISGNAAGNGGAGGQGGQGGGIRNLGTLNLTNATVSGNTAGTGGTNAAGGNGGGILNSGTMTLTNTTVSGNTAGNSGTSGAGGSGGGIYNLAGTLNLVNATISNNTTGTGNANPGGSGGGVFIFAGTVNAKNSIIAGNNLATGGSGPDGFGVINSQDYNLIGNTSGVGFTGTTTHNITGVSANLSTLANNGGATQTMLPLPGSPALNAIPVANISKDTADADSDNDKTEDLPVDQRGFTRVVGTNFDIGAVEANYSIVTSAGTTPQSAVINTAFANALAVIVKESNIVRNNVSVTFTAGSAGSATGTFTGPVSSTSVSTNSSGVATAPTFTANGIVGGPYNVTASFGTGLPTTTFALTNTKSIATVNLSNLTQTYDGTPKSATATTNPPGLTVVITYDGSTTPPTNFKSGGYAVVATVNDANYDGTASGTLNIDKAGSTTTVTVSSAVFDGNPHGGTANVVGVGGLNQSVTPVAYTGRNGTVYSSTTAPTNVGDYTASATFAGDNNHNGSSDSKDFQITKANQTITFNNPGDKTYGDADFNVSATTTAIGLSVSFAATGQCTVTGTLVHITAAGSCKITASQAGNSNYNAASSVDQTFQIAKASTTTALSSSANPSEFGEDVTFTATVTSTAGTPTGTVTFKDNGSALSGCSNKALDGTGKATCTASGLAVGNHPITVEYSGDTNFAVSNGTLSGGQVVNILAAISVDDVSLTEGNSGTKNFDFTVKLSKATNLTVKVDFATADGTATVAGSDYQSNSGTLTFNPGDVSKTVTVLVNGDNTNEPNETFFVNLTNAQNANVADNQAQGTILNDDSPGVQFSTNSYSFSETLGHGDIIVNRIGDTSQPLTVEYITSDQSGTTPCQTLNTGIASDRCDYATAAGTLRFAAGQSSLTIPLIMINDAYVEGPEQLSIKLSNPTGGSLGSVDTATVTITDNDSQLATFNPIDDLDFFLRMLYIDFLGREPEAAGLQFWKSRMSGACPPGEVCDREDTALKFFNSAEFRERGYLVYLFYHAGLGTRPNYSSWIMDVSKLNGFKTVAEQEAAKDALINEFMNRQAFMDIYNGAQTGQTFVDAMIQKSGITPASRQALIDNYATVGRGKTFRAFMETPEVQAAFVDRAFVSMLYFGLLRRNAEQAGFQFWMQKLVDTNHDYRYLMGGFLQSHEYRFRFALLPPPSNVDSEFKVEPPAPGED